MNIYGLKMFLLITLKLISEGVKENLEFVENSMSTGLATALFEKHKKVYEEAGIGIDQLEAIDQYYKNLVGVAEGSEEKCFCDNDDLGLQLVIGLALCNM